MDSNSDTLISIIVPIHNGSDWIDQCFNSIFKQELPQHINLEVCVCNDSSNDNTKELLNKWNSTLHSRKIELKVYHNESKQPGGVGYSKNKAVGISSGSYLCFQDIDDIMLSKRILKQYEVAKVLPHNTIVGCQFRRFPDHSTKRYTDWANNLADDKLDVQIYTSHGPTVIMPTWFCHRKVFDQVGGFSEKGSGTPEDLIFFYKHLDLQGKLYRVNECLLIYTYHPNATTFSIQENTIWKIRVERLENVVLSQWNKFTIWNAGKQGRKLYNSLSKASKSKVIVMCDVDVKKIGKKYTPFDAKSRRSEKPLDIVHFKNAKPPFIVCVKIDMTEGQFEDNLASLLLTENVDYVLFS